MDDWIAKRGLALVPAARMKTLTARSDLRGLLHFGSQLGALAAMGAVLAYGWGTWWCVPPFMAYGLQINCLYAGQHEMSHRTAFRSRWLNDWAGQAIGFIEIYPSRWDRYFHFAHHRHTQDWEKDPELLIRKPYSRATWLLNMTGLLYWYGRCLSVLTLASGRAPAYAYWLTPSQRREVILEAQLHLAGYAAILAISLAFRSLIAVEFWLAPMVLMKWAHQLQNVGEHTGLTHENDTLRNTRTLMGPGVVRWLIWNMTYHAAHHTYPGVPFHALPALQNEISAELGRPLPETGYIAAQIEIYVAIAAHDPSVASVV